MNKFVISLITMRKNQLFRDRSFGYFSSVRHSLQESERMSSSKTSGKDDHLKPNFNLATDSTSKELSDPLPSQNPPVLENLMTLSKKVESNYHDNTIEIGYAPDTRLKDVKAEAKVDDEFVTVSELSRKAKEIEESYQEALYKLREENQILLQEQKEFAEILRRQLFDTKENSVPAYKPLNRLVA